MVRANYPPIAFKIGKKIYIYNGYKFALRLLDKICCFHNSQFMMRLQRFFSSDLYLLQATVEATRRVSLCETVCVCERERERWGLRWWIMPQWRKNPLFASTRYKNLAGYQEALMAEQVIRKPSIIYILIPVAQKKQLTVLFFFFLNQLP